MKRPLPYFLRNLLLCCTLLLLTTGARASHLVGADLYYTWISGNQYKISVILYGDCASGGPGTAFSQLPTAAPQVCVFDGTSAVTTLTLTIQAPTAGVEITPVCPADSLNTQCHNLSSTNPGIKKFIYTKLYTVPYTSANWKFVFNGSMGATSAGRNALLTNLVGPGSTIMGLTATLNNVVAPNSSPILTILPVPFFCLNGNDTYNPGAVDADADSLTFKLTPAENSTGGCSSSAFPVCSYMPGYSATAPLSTTAGSFSFDTVTGQIAFIPNMLQRSVVVYSISEYRNNVLVGTMQREMSFTVITCVTPPPTGALTSVTAGVIEPNTPLDTGAHYRFHICSGEGAFSIGLTSSETDVTNNITVSNTGLPPGALFNVVNNGTPNPQTTISWNAGDASTTVTPGIYTFYVTFTDNACPIQGSQTRAFTIAIYPIPTLAYTVVDSASCLRDANVSITPGGLGNPWTVVVQDALGNHIDSNVGVTGTYLDTLAPGNDSLIIYSAVSSFCNSRHAIIIPPPVPVTPSATFTTPTFCGNNDDTMTITGLHPLEADTLFYTYNGVAVAAQPIFSSSGGTYMQNGLCAGPYTNLYIKYGSCVSTPIGPFNVNNPPFTIDRVVKVDPSACGFNDGSIKIIGMHPGQFDTLRYDFNGAPQTYVTSFVTSDSSITVSNLLEGTYSNIVVNTTGACPNSPAGCTSNVLGPINLVTSQLHAIFTYDIHYGCNGDTVFFHDNSTPLSSTAPLFYRWYFGDGSTDTARNPMHIYHPSAATTYSPNLIITNTRCVDSVSHSFALPGLVHALFTSSPDIFICQDSAVAFRDTSDGAIANYAWTFGDGTLGTTGKDVSHAFANSGSYVVSLYVNDNIPCFDTFTKIVHVDSTSVISIHASDTTICRGSKVTFEGTYTSIGYTDNVWSFGDGSGFTNANPIQHSFDAVGVLPIMLTVHYRACGTAVVSRNIKVYDNPNIYLGPDSAICPGGTPIELYDVVNAINPAATWLWNTGETTPNIVVNQAGYYAATVTINGCIGTDTVWIANDCYVNFPNIFTPNGDGINDYFFPRNLLARGLVDFKMSIFNRWGEKVYETKNTEGLGWDGTYNSEKQPEGVFIYQIDAIFKDGQKLHKQGNITLVR